MYLKFLFRAKEKGNLKTHWLAKCFGYNNLKSFLEKIVHYNLILKVIFIELLLLFQFI